MTPFRIVVSWLAFLFLLYRGVVLSIEGIQDFYGSRWSRWKLDDVRLGRILLWSPFWFLLALCLIAPWIRKLLIAANRLPENIRFDESSAEMLNLFARWAFCLLFVAGFFQLVPRNLGDFLDYTSSSSRDFGNIFDLFYPFIAVISLVCVLAPELAAIASSGFTRFIDAVFFPGGREAKPPYTLKLARFYVEKQRWEEAETEYARMLSFYPDQPEDWQERLTLAFRRRDAPAGSTPERVLAEALKALKAPTDREAVYQQFTRGRPV